MRAPVLLATLAFSPALLLPPRETGPARAPMSSATRVCADLPTRGDCPDLTELLVKDVIPLTDARTNAIVLVSRDRHVVLPVFVDGGAALAIAFRLSHRTPPHPLSQDLLEGVLSKLGGQVTGVRIDGVHEHMLVTHVFIRQGDHEMGLSARPSDAVALALSGGARIFATRRVLAEAGITREQINDLRKNEPSLDPNMGVGGSGPADPEPAPVPPAASPDSHDVRL